MSDLMKHCEVKALFVENGIKVWRWVVRPVEGLDGGREIRCAHCHGRVRVHRQHVDHGPADHVEHLSRQDSQGCRGGHHFEGIHRLSTDPVT